MMFFSYVSIQGQCYAEPVFFSRIGFESSALGWMIRNWLIWTYTVSVAEPVGASTFCSTLHKTDEVLIDILYRYVSYHIDKGYLKNKYL